MRWRHSVPLLLGILLVAAAALLGDPEPPQAQATSLPCITVSPAGAVAGGVLGIGNPIGDACEAVTDPILGAAGDAVLGPLKDAAGAIGKGVFNQVTAWVADGAVWLIGEIAAGIDTTTSPNLLSKGFLHQYRLMWQVAAVMAALMAIFAVLEALARGEASLLWRVFLVNLPLAAIATSVAYVVVQLLLATSDGMGEAITRSTGADTHSFFKGTIEALAAVGAKPGAVAGATIGGPGLGKAPGGQVVGEAAGAVAVPLFVGFIAAAVMTFAALFVWIELLMRDAAVYVVALFMPLALAAAIWPRWGSALRRTCELLIVVIFSKFVIVAVIALAASLVARGDGSAEQVLAGAAMLLLACFSPFMLLKLVPFAEGAISSAYSRQGASGGALRTVEVANSMQMMRRAALANWAGGGAGGAGGGGRAFAGGGGKGKAPVGGGSAGAGALAGAEGAAAGPAGVAAMPAAAAAGSAKAAKGAAERLAGSGVAEAAGSPGGSAAHPGGASRPAVANGGEGSPHPSGRVAAGPSQQGSHAAGGGSQGAGRGQAGLAPVTKPPLPAAAAEPSQPQGGEASRAGAKPPRPGGEAAGTDAKSGGRP